MPISLTNSLTFFSFIFCFPFFPSTAKSFSYSGAIVNFTVPTAVFTLNITAQGAQGGLTSGATGPGGRGAKLFGVFTVQPNQILWIMVGQQPPTGGVSYFPGGGGATFIGIGSTYTSSLPLLVAGGGGGVYDGSLAPTTNAVITNVTGSGDGGGYSPGRSGNGAPSQSCGGSSKPTFLHKY